MRTLCSRMLGLGHLPVHVKMSVHLALQTHLFPGNISYGKFMDGFQASRICCYFSSEVPEQEIVTSQVPLLGWQVSPVDQEQFRSSHVSDKCDSYPTGSTDRACGSITTQIVVSIHLWLLSRTPSAYLENILNARRRPSVLAGPIKVTVN